METKKKVLLFRLFFRSLLYLQDQSYNYEN